MTPHVISYLVARAPIREANHRPLRKGCEGAPSPARLRLPRWETQCVEVIPPGPVVLQQALRLLQDVPDCMEGVDLAQLDLQGSNLSHKGKQSWSKNIVRWVTNLSFYTS